MVDGKNINSVPSIFYWVDRPSPLDQHLWIEWKYIRSCTTNILVIKSMLVILQWGFVFRPGFYPGTFRETSEIPQEVLARSVAASKIEWLQWSNALQSFKCRPNMKWGEFTCVGWQVTLCDPIRQVTPRRCEITCSGALHLLLAGFYPGTFWGKVPPIFGTSLKKFWPGL